MKFLLQKQYVGLIRKNTGSVGLESTTKQEVEGVWEEYTAGGDTPKKAIEALLRAGAGGKYRIIQVEGGGLNVVYFEIKEKSTWTVEQSSQSTTPPVLPPSGQPYDSGSQ